MSVLNLISRLTYCVCGGNEPEVCVCVCVPASVHPSSAQWEFKCSQWVCACDVWCVCVCEMCVCVCGWSVYWVCVCTVCVHNVFVESVCLQWVCVFSVSDAPPSKWDQWMLMRRATGIAGDHTDSQFCVYACLQFVRLQCVLVCVCSVCVSVVCVRLCVCLSVFPVDICQGTSVKQDIITWKSDKFFPHTKKNMSA